MRMKRKLTQRAATAFVTCCEAGAAVALAAVVANIVIPMAYAERGYWAIGGEWLLILLVAVGGFEIIHKYISGERED